MPNTDSIPLSPPPLAFLARAAVLEMLQAYLQEPPSVPDKVCSYLVALVDNHLFGGQSAPSTACTEPRFCWACNAEALPGEHWCAAHDPARNEHTAAALDRLDRDITTGDQLLNEVKQEIAATNGHHSPPSETSDLSDLSDYEPFPPPTGEEARSIAETVDRLELLKARASAPAYPPARATDQAARAEAAIQSARDYILDAHRKKTPISTIADRVRGFVDMSRSEADALVFKTLREAGPQPDNSPSKPLDLEGRGNGSLPASDREAKKREDAAWWQAQNSAKWKGESLNEAEWRLGYRDRRAAAAGGAR